MDSVATKCGSTHRVEMDRFKQIYATFVEFIGRLCLRLSRHPLKTLVVISIVFIAENAWAANEWVIQGQIHGIDSNEGVWVGIVSGEPSYQIGVRIPHDDFELDETPQHRNQWTYSRTGDFKIKTDVEEEAVLLVVAKNRIPIEIPLHSEDDELPIEVRVSSGIGLKGLVRSGNGKPIVGAKVSVQSGDRSHRIPLFALPTWETAKDGSFELAGLKEHRHFTLAVTADGYAPLILQATRIREGNSSMLEIELEKGYFVSGKVVSKDGEGLPDLKVFASWSRDAVDVVEVDGKLTVKGGRGWNSYDTGTRTNSDGSFRMGPFAKGTTGRLWADLASVGSVITQRISAPFDDLILRLDQENVRGRVLDKTTGAPIEDFWVSMWAGERRSHSVEASNGVFDLPVYAIEADGTEITISARGYTPWKRFMFRGSRGEYDLGDVTLERERTIRGTVRDADTGAPIENVLIEGVTERSHDPYKEPYRNNWSASGMTQSDGAGEFTLDHVSPDVKSLYLIAGRGRFASIDLPAGEEEIEIELDFSGILEGSLIRLDRTPVEGVIEIKGSSWWLPWKIKSDGSFRIEGLTPDTYTLAAETDAGLVETRTVTLKANERVTEFELLVQPGWTARGTISGLEGIEYVEITAEDSDGRDLTRKGFGNGEYAIHGLPPQVTLIARSSSGHTLVREFIGGNDLVPAIDFHIENESGLTGWLTSGGKPLRGMLLQIEPDNANAVTANVTTTDSGRYEARRLAEGRHVIHTETGHSFEVDINGDTVFDIELPQNSLSGFVRSKSTRLPIGGGLVKLVRTDSIENVRPIELTKRVGSDGSFLFEGLIAGTYEVLVEHPHADTVSTRTQISGSETVDLTVVCANTNECFDGPRDGSRLSSARF
ncbi:MAG: carboxypeptidase-like regulatory domain-containing protein [Gammaproteobacteria bacterium]|nr:carboxypeptidase-like regulatory domain-containing protein [Gammaproteobacteria bacterium]